MTRSVTRKCFYFQQCNKKKLAFFFFLKNKFIHIKIKKLDYVPHQGYEQPVQVKLLLHTSISEVCSQLFLQLHKIKQMILLQNSIQKKKNNTFWVAKTRSSNFWNCPPSSLALQTTLQLKFCKLSRLVLKKTQNPKFVLPAVTGAPDML